MAKKNFAKFFDVWPTLVINLLILTLQGWLFNYPTLGSKSSSRYLYYSTRVCMLEEQGIFACFKKRCLASLLMK
ncbi:hypothetical protein DB42_EA01050 [Neochlamydia sp. EPS4]|nr:hypothetical protein DB42_EA01050 [Neochlamydia sp. EPS4]